MPRSALHGGFAECAIGSTTVALCYEWEVNVETDTVDVTAHGDVWKVFDALDSGWTFRARSWIVPASAAHLINTLWSSGALPAAVTVTGYSGTRTGGTPIFSGSGIPIRGSISAPMALAEQEFEVRGTGAPTVGV